MCIISIYHVTSLLTQRVHHLAHCHLYIYTCTSTCMYITCVYKYYIYVYFVCLSCMSRYLTRVYTCSINGYRRYICRVISLLTQHVHHLAHCHLYIYMYSQVYTCIHIYVLVCLHVYSHILYAHILCLVDMSTISRQCALSCVHVHV